MNNPVSTTPAYFPVKNAIFLKRGADGTSIVHELIHANTDRSGGHDFSENFANYLTFLVCESLHKADRPAREDNIRDFLRGIGAIEKIRGLIGEKLFGLLVTDFYTGLKRARFRLLYLRFQLFKNLSLRFAFWKLDM